jgi:preprotein translocase subunit SecA
MFYQILIELVLYNKKQQDQENKIVKNLGGLYIVGTERNDSRRVDNQLRGRCGDRVIPFKIFLSLDDNLLRLLVDQNSKFHADSNFR